VTPAPLLLELLLPLELLLLLELELLELLLELELELELLEVSGPLTVPPPQPTTMPLAHTARVNARTAAKLSGRETIPDMSCSPRLRGNPPLTRTIMIDEKTPRWPRSPFASGRAARPSR